MSVQCFQIYLETTPHGEQVPVCKVGSLAEGRDLIVLMDNYVGDPSQLPTCHFMRYYSGSNVCARNLETGETYCYVDDWEAI